ncbi:MAG: M56 family metallopeptidase, partial [Planctomycetes bacterium]|nr:M56 family metallopeptidase [Planctomycetota bacterium]
RRAGLRGAPPILLSRRLRAPAVLGLLRPVVLFPADFAGSPAEARLAILHECLHLRRRDPAAAALLAAVRVIWWFHPAAWLAERRLGALRESCCDADAAALLGGEAPRYREALLAAARRRLEGEGAPAGALALLGAGEGLPERIRALEGRAWSRRCGSRAASGAAAAALAILALPLLPSGGRAPLPSPAGAASAPLPAPAGGRRAVPGLAPGAVERARTLLEGAARGEREACIGLRWAAMAVAAEEGSLPSR